MSKNELNAEERELLESYEAYEWQSVDNLEQAIQIYSTYAQKTLANLPGSSPASFCQPPHRPSKESAA